MKLNIKGSITTGLLKSSSANSSSIGHPKNQTIFWKRVADAKKPKFYDVLMCFVLEFSIYIIKFGFFGINHSFSKNCLIFCVTNTGGVSWTTLYVLISNSLNNMCHYFLNGVTFPPQPVCHCHLLVWKLEKEEIGLRE